MSGLTLSQRLVISCLLKVLQLVDLGNVRAVGWLTINRQVVIGWLGIRMFPMRFDLELQIFVFRSQKQMTLLMQSKYAKSDRFFFDLRIR